MPEVFCVVKGQRLVNAVLIVVAIIIYIEREEHSVWIIFRNFSLGLFVAADKLLQIFLTDKLFCIKVFDIIRRERRALFISLIKFDLFIKLKQESALIILTRSAVKQYHFFTVKVRENKFYFDII